MLLSPLSCEGLTGFTLHCGQHSPGSVPSLQELHQWEPNTMEPFGLKTPQQVPDSPRGREGLSVQSTDEHCLRKEIKARVLIHIEILVEEN